MSGLKKYQTKLEELFVPLMTKLSNNKILKSISNGVMMTLPLTLGASVFTILGSFPVPAVSKFLEEMGISQHFNAISGATLGILGLFISFTVAYNFTKLNSADGVVGGLFSLASFLILMPQSVGEGDNIIGAFASRYLGSSGLFVAFLTAICIAKLYTIFSKNKKLLIKLPDSVPPMVAQSFEPLIVGLIIFAIVFIIRLLVGYTSYGNLFDLVNTIIATPLMSIGGSIPAIMFVFVLGNILFFFGIHPSPLHAIMSPILLGMQAGALENIKAGENIQYLTNLVTYDFINNDGTGSTLSLLLAILIFGRAKRYKMLAKLSIGPNIFGINEPVIFGLPIMFNPILLIPFAMSSVVSGFLGYLSVKIGFITTYNSAVAMGMPWTLPKFITSFFIYGWQGVVVRIIVMIAIVFLYYPFFKILDNQELALENQ